MWSVGRVRGVVFGKMKDDGEELHGESSARRVVGRDLTESGVGSAVLCPGYMFLHLSCREEREGSVTGQRREAGSA